MGGGDSILYEVEVPEDDALLNSDAIFGQQPKKVRDAINRLYEEEYDAAPPPDWWDDRQVYQDIILREEGYTDPDDVPGDYDMDMDNGELAGNARLASEKLNSIGIKGVKFLGDDDDVGFVVFDDNAIQTIEYYQRQNSQSIAEKKLQKDVVAWNKLIDELEAVPKQTVLMLNQTPLVMHMVGADFKKLYATPHMFERLFKSKDGSKGSFGKNELKQIPQALTDPIAIFDQDNGRKLFLLDLKTSTGSPVVVPVEFSARKDFATVNLALTAFAKEKNGKPKFGWLKNLKGKELYVNTKKSTSLNTSAGADSLGVLSERSIKDGANNSSVTENVLTEADLVKERERYPDMYQGVYNPVSKAKA